MDLPDQWGGFIKQFQVLSGIDLLAYKRPQMERRINSFMRSVNSPNYAAFIELLKNDREVLRRFLDHLTINVSEFFRNIQQWQILEREILPNLLEQRSSLRLWSAGCSTGEEVYSLAMMLKEKGIHPQDRILATDIDREVLEKGGQGLYSKKAVEGVAQPIRDRYFTPDGSMYRVHADLRKMVRFERHDLLKDRFLPDQDLILCRNVVIYFTEETKQILYRKFAAALRPGGILFIGSTEQIFQARELGLKPLATFFYRKESGLGIKN
ncbi:MAG TPA: protein-glutamate O-methyltransferase CheR [Syntrophomonadaceae bacterium]|nr:protein-glutamate O-methyltransferase CheR [Syntrophomonadaceae bacterium]